MRCIANPELALRCGCLCGQVCGSASGEGRLDRAAAAARNRRSSGRVAAHNAPYYDDNKLREDRAAA